MRRAPLLVVVLTAALPATAHAGTLTMNGTSTEYTAPPGEVNDIRVSRSDRLRLRDDGARIFVDAPPNACRRIDDHEVDCALLGGGPRILTGDRDDRVRTSGVTAWLGPGNDVAVDDTGLAGLYGEEGDDDLTGDTIEGGDGADRLTLVPTALTPRASGGPGDDVITGTAVSDDIAAASGFDRVAAGDGDDVISDGFADGASGSASDVFDGGAGRDALSYHRSTAIRVDLATGVATAEGERDELTAIEIASTGTGDDVLIGGPGPDALDGGWGDDLLDGGPGGDRLAGGLGDDRIAGGEGDDAIEGGHGNDLAAGNDGNDVLDGGDRRDVTKVEAGVEPVLVGTGRDVLDGGAGDDRLVVSGDRWLDRAGCGDGADTADADVFDAVAASCETVTRRPLASLFAAHRRERGPWVKVRRRRAVVEVPCTIPSLGGVVVLRRGARVVGRATWTCVTAAEPRGLEPSHGLGVRLTARIARRLRRVRRLRVTVEMRWADGSMPSLDRSVLLLRR